MDTRFTNQIAEAIVKILQKAKEPVSEKELITKIYLACNEIIPASIFNTLKRQGLIIKIKDKWQIKNKE